MFVHIRKHQKWLLGLIVIVVGISFVVFFTPNVQYGNLDLFGGGDMAGSIAGRPVHRKEFREAYQEVTLSFGERQGVNYEQATANRLLLLEKAKERGIEVSEEAAAKWIVNAFKDPEMNEFRRESYDNAVTNILPRYGMNKGDLQRFARNQVIIGQLQELAGLAGELVTPQEAERLYREQNLQANAQAVFFSSTDYVNLGESLEGLEAFYTNRMALYREPEKRRIHYLSFAATNYLAEAKERLTESTNLAEMISGIYLEKGTNSFTKDGVVLGEEEAKEQIQRQEFKKVGQEIAKEKAKELAEELFNIEPMKAESLPELAAAKGYKAEVSEPFTADQAIPGIGDSYELTGLVFQLTEEIPFTRAFHAADGTYLVALHSVLPSEVPPLEEIRGQVQTDFYEQKSLENAREAAATFHTSLTNGLAQGKAFEAICKEAGHEPVQMPLFSQSSRTLAGADPRANLYLLQSLAFDIEVGEVSRVSQTEDGAMILFVHSFVEAKEEQMKEELPDYAKTLRQRRRSETFGAWFQEEQKTLNFPFSSASGGL